MRISIASPSAPATIGKQLLAISSYPPLLSHTIAMCYVTWIGSLICFDFIRKYKRTSASSKFMSTKYYTLLPIAFLIILFVKQELEMEFFFTSDNMYKYFTSGSKLMTIDDVPVHHITNMCHNEGQRKEFDVIHVAFHGFGSNCLSFAKMFDVLQSGVYRDTHGYIATDVIGFGYNPRVARLKDSSKSLDIYKPFFTAKAAGMIANSYCASNSGKKLFFIGHSMGYLPSMLAAINACSEERINNNIVLVLFAPALLVANIDSYSHEVDTKEILRTYKEKVQNASSSNKGASKSHYITRKLKLLGSLVINLVTLPLRILLKRILRASSVWSNALSTAWGSDKSHFDDRTIAQYKLPANYSNFLLDFYYWLVAQSDSDSYRPKNTAETMSYVSCLIALLNLGAKVVIMHGEEDSIVPIGNSYRLVKHVHSRIAKTAGKLEFHALSGVGHVAHEERPNLFVEKILNKF